MVADAQSSPCILVLAQSRVRSGPTPTTGRIPRRHPDQRTNRIAIAPSPCILVLAQSRVRSGLKQRERLRRGRRQYRRNVPSRTRVEASTRVGECQNIHTSHIRFGDVVVLTTTFIGRRGHATYDHPGATRGSRLRVTVHTSRGEQLLRGVTRTSSFHPRSSRPIRFLRISYHTRHPSRAPAPCLGHQLPRPEPLRSPTGTSTTILIRERAVLCHCGCARLFAHNLFRAR